MEITRNHFRVHFEKARNTCVWCFCVWRLRDVEEEKFFFKIYLRRLTDVTQKRSFLRRIWDVLKTSQKSHLFWDVSERSLRCLSQWRSDWDLSETSYAIWKTRKKIKVYGIKVISKYALLKWITQYIRYNI